MTDQPEGEKPALTVVIQSWWTPAMAVIMLVVGLLLGYFGRGVISKSAVATEEVAAVATTAPTQSGVQVSVPTATVDPEIAAIQTRDDLMAYIVRKTNHFMGNSNAPVTLIEFSDYQ
jgi:protein-disulfide isomerase